MTVNRVLYDRDKYIVWDYFFVYERVFYGVFVVYYIFIKFSLVDILIKRLIV